MNTKGYEIYTYFGRVIERLAFNDDELAVHTYERAYKEMVRIGLSGRVCWIRTYC